MKRMDEYTIELTNMLDKLFGKRIVTMMYVYSMGDFSVYVDGKELEPDLWLSEIIKKYDWIRHNESKFFKKIKSYEDMNKIIEDEQLEVYIYPEQYEWTRK